MRIAVLEPGAPPPNLLPRFGGYGGMVAAMLGEGFEVKTFDICAGCWPESQGWDGYVITGSSSGVYDPDPWIPDLKAWVLRTAGSAPMIGICFGHQLMAEAFGGRVVKSPKGWGVGLHTYDLATVAAWMPEEARTLSLPVSHQDQVVEIGGGAQVLGGSEFCPFGFLAWPDLRAVSLQPHPEFDPAYAEALIVTREDGPLTREHANVANRLLTSAQR